MANRKTLKKNINYICSELFAECVALTLYKTDVNHEDLDNVMARILTMQDEFIKRVNHTQPGAVKAFYKKLYQDINAQVEEIVASISQLS